MNVAWMNALRRIALFAAGFAVGGMFLAMFLSAYLDKISSLLQFAQFGFLGGLVLGVLVGVLLPSSRRPSNGHDQEYMDRLKYHTLSILDKKGAHGSSFEGLISLINTAENSTTYAVESSLRQAIEEMRSSSWLTGTDSRLTLTGAGRGVVARWREASADADRRVTDDRRVRGIID